MSYLHPLHLGRSRKSCLLHHLEGKTQRFASVQCYWATCLGLSENLFFRLFTRCIHPRNLVVYLRCKISPPISATAIMCKYCFLKPHSWGSPQDMWYASNGWRAKLKLKWLHVEQETFSSLWGSTETLLPPATAASSKISMYHISFVFPTSGSNWWVPFIQADWQFTK